MLKPDPSSSAPVRCALSVCALLRAGVPRGGHLAAGLQSGQLIFFCELLVREDQNILSLLLCYRVSNAHTCSCTRVAAETCHSLAGDAAAPCPGRTVAVPTRCRSGQHRWHLTLGTGCAHTELGNLAQSFSRLTNGKSSTAAQRGQRMGQVVLAACRTGPGSGGAPGKGWALSGCGTGGVSLLERDLKTSLCPWLELPGCWVLF